MSRWGGGDPDAFVHQFVDDWTQCPIDPPTAALLRFEDPLTGEPASMTEGGVEALRTAGWNDEAIHDATQVISYFNYINRVADALGVEQEPDAPIWGKSRHDDSGED